MHRANESGISKWEQMAQEEMAHPSERREMPDFCQWQPADTAEVQQEKIVHERPDVASLTVERLGLITRAVQDLTALDYLWS